MGCPLERQPMHNAGWSLHKIDEMTGNAALMRLAPLVKLFKVRRHRE